MYGWTDSIRLERLFSAYKQRKKDLIFLVKELIPVETFLQLFLLHLIQMSGDMKQQTTSITPFLKMK